MPAQGVTSFTIDPNNPSVMIDQNWVNDIVSLGTSATGPLLIRADVRADSGNNLAISQYQQAFQVYSNNNMATHGLLTENFDLPAYAGDPNASLGYQGNQFLNPYINDFSFRAENFAGQLTSAGLRSYFVWNEPNDTNGAYLNQANFAALMYQCYHRIKAAGTGGYVYMGGILWPYGPFDPTTATNMVIQYLQPVYSYLAQNGGGIPWDAVNVHPHLCGFSENDMIYLRSQLDSLKSQYGDTTPVFVGEWGITHQEAAQSGCMLNSFTYIRNHFDAMWYFQHPNNANFGCCDPASCPSSYGLAAWNEGTNFYITGHCPDWDQLHYLLQFPNP